VKTDTADIPDTARIEDVTVKFSGGADGFINNEKLGSIAYEIFYGGAWIPLGDIDHDTANTDEYSFTVNNRRLVEGMRFGNRDSINIAFRSTVPSEGIWNDSKVKMNSIEMKVRYNLDGDRIKYPKYGNYYISSATKNWQEARNDCINRGGDLLIINSEEEQQYIQSLSGYVDSSWYWMGFHDLGHDLEWRSVSGTYIWQGASTGSTQNDAYTNWYTGLPSSGYDCVALMSNITYFGKWYNTTCTTARPYICELNRENSYMISTDTKTWDAARTACIGFGGDLVTIDGYNEQKELETLASGAVNYWLGFTDRDVDGEWRWVTGSNRWNGTSTGSSYFYTNWYTSLPYSGTNYQYANFYGGYNYKWNTAYYTTSTYYICEFESPQFCSLNEDQCLSGNTCCSEVCNTDDQECVNCIEENYHGCDAKADCCSSADSCYNSKFSVLFRKLCFT
ncbi:MAG TPA: C-type lectin domain-containing protein, partial [bacterium]|nr:C-type lectin domain-containing protein [bacterium]